MKIPSHLTPTIVTTLGTIIRIGKALDGLVVVSADNGKPVMSFDEITGDDTVVHVFCKFAPGAAFADLEKENDAQIVGTEGVLNSHEIVIRKDEHQELTTAVNSNSL